MNVPYQVALEVPANTPEAAPVSMTLTPGAGFLSFIQAIFPPGALGAVGVKVFEAGSQIAPMPYGWAHGNAEVITWQINRRLQGPPYRLVFSGYSTALDWPHTITFRMELIA